MRWKSAPRYFFLSLSSLNDICQISIFTKTIFDFPPNLSRSSSKTSPTIIFETTFYAIRIIFHQFDLALKDQIFRRLCHIVYFSLFGNLFDDAALENWDSVSLVLLTENWLIWQPSPCPLGRWSTCLVLAIYEPILDTKSVSSLSNSHTLLPSVTRKKSPNVHKSCPKMISLEKW